MATKTDKYVAHDKLMVDCYEQESGYLHFSKPLLQLSDRELRLCDGRFITYSPEIDSNPITFVTGSFYVAFNNCLMWLYDNCDHPWNFTVSLNKDIGRIGEHPSQDVFKYGFFFSLPTDAIKFKLNITHTND